MRRHVARAARVRVVAPHAADLARALEDEEVRSPPPGLLEPDGGAEAAESAPDDGDVEVTRGLCGQCVTSADERSVRASRTGELGTLLPVASSVQMEDDHGPFDAHRPPRSREWDVHVWRYARAQARLRRDCASRGRGSGARRRITRKRCACSGAWSRSGWTSSTRLTRMRPVRERRAHRGGAPSVPEGGHVVATKRGARPMGPGVWSLLGRPDYLAAAVRDEPAAPRRSIVSSSSSFIASTRRSRRTNSSVCSPTSGREGKVHHVGLSEVGGADEIEAARKAMVLIATVQNLYNLQDRKAEAVVDLLREARDRLLSPWYLIASGKLLEPGGALAAVAKEAKATPSAGGACVAAAEVEGHRADPGYVERGASRGELRCGRGAADGRRR